MTLSAEQRRALEIPSNSMRLQFQKDVEQTGSQRGPTPPPSKRRSAWNKLAATAQTELLALRPIMSPVWSAHSAANAAFASSSASAMPLASISSADNEPDRGLR